MTRSNIRLGYGDYLRFRELVHAHSGLHYPEKKRNDLELGVQKALESAPAGIDDPAKYYNFLQAAHLPEVKEELARFINLLTIGETHFFRDTPQIDALANHVLPELIRKKRAAARAANHGNPGIPQLRLWSAGCATGEEAYSLAILLKELIPDIDNWRIHILATDINSNSLQRARQAVYSDWSFRESRALSMRALYFQRQGHKKFQLRDDIRHMVTFARQNLIEDDFPAIRNNTMSMDLILCRNVTIYFSEQTTRQLAAKFYATLVDDGWLVVGHSEPSLLIYRDFQVRSFPGAILYQRTGQPMALPDDWQQLDKKLQQQNGTAVTPPPLPQPPAILTPVRKPVSKPLAPPRRTNLLTPLPEDSNIYAKARQQLSAGQIDEAIRTLEMNQKKLTRDEKAYAYCLLARAYADKGLTQQARRWAEKAVAANNLVSETYFVLSMIAEQDDDLDAAIAALKKVIYLDSQHPLAHFNLAMLSKKQNDQAQMRRSLQNAQRILQSWPAEKEIPDSSGTSAARLQLTIQQLLYSFEE